VPRRGDRSHSLSVVAKPLGRIQIEISGTRRAISWDARNALLGRIGNDDTGRAIKWAFDAVGASRPVELTLDERRRIVEVIDKWSAGNPGGSDELPGDIFHLRGWLGAEVAGLDREKRP
jgi:hypothetical protein